jgi:Domain of unknown function (DUF4337)
MPEVEIPNPEELEEMRNKGFTRRVAITTAIYAVMLAIAALGGNNAMKDMLLAQQQSSDQWACTSGSRVAWGGRTRSVEKAVVE